MTRTRTPQLEWPARAGLVARGAVYVVIGVLAVKLALGDGGKAVDQQGALHTVAKQPFGKALLVVLAIGLAGYAVWRLVRAAVGHGPEGDDDAKERVSGFVSGIAYAALCVTAVKILAGLVLIGVGLEQGRKGVGKKFLEQSKTAEMSHRVRQAFTGLGVFGHLARMVVFALIGWFLIKAALDYSPKEAVGLDGALAELSQSSLGPLALGIVAAGLIGFGLFSIADARYRRV